MFLLRNMQGTPRPLIRYYKFLKTVQKRIDLNKRQMTMSKVQTSPSLVFIKYLLQYMGEPRYLVDDIFKVYTQDISNASNMISRKFDTTESGVSHYKNTFIKDSKIEYFIPTNGIIGYDVNILDNWNKWKDIQPIRMMVNDSRELNVDPQSYRSQLEYKSDQPTYSLFCIDSSALLMKYLVYLREYDIPFDNTIIDEFILDYVIAPLYDDVLNVWISNYLLDVMSDKEVDTSLISTILNQSELNNATNEIKELIDRLKNGSLRIGDIMHTFFYRDKSIYDIIDIYADKHKTYSSNRYIGIELLKMSKLLSIIIILLTLTFDKQQETQYIRKIVIELDILSRKNWKTHIRYTDMTKEVYMLINRLNRLKGMYI